MADYPINDQMVEMFIYETSQNIEQLEQSVVMSEAEGFTPVAVNEIMRNMHTIKGSAAMMMYTAVSTLAHAMEDLFFYLRERRPERVDYSVLSDLVLDGIDFIKVELHKIKAGEEADGDASLLIATIHEFLAYVKQTNETNETNEASAAEAPTAKQEMSRFDGSDGPAEPVYEAVAFFQDGCEMENVRAFGIVHGLSELATVLSHEPKDLVGDETSAEAIRNGGFRLRFASAKPVEELRAFLDGTLFLQSLELFRADGEAPPAPEATLGMPQPADRQAAKALPKDSAEYGQPAQSMISVNVDKLDRLMDLVGEMVIAEAMVTQNPDLKGLQLDRFNKAAQLLHKITSELQDAVMSIRMVPLTATFQKMHRIVRDMSRNLGKEVRLRLVGEETEVDKNVIQHISDPLMHLIRNAIDHGIEPPADRQKAGKPAFGTVTLEAKNAGGDVYVLIKDDGRGLSKAKLLAKARENGLLAKPESEMSDKEIFGLIFLPGFSTKDSISEYSGRGVGMDVVSSNLSQIGGVISVDSEEGSGTTIMLKIPLTLAIIDGMTIRVGSSRYTVPTASIVQSFRPAGTDIIRDPDGNEMILVRGRCYSIVRLHELYGVRSDTSSFTEGILVMVEHDGAAYCLFADELLGQQQVVVKALPEYIKRMGNIRGLAGCTLLGDGSISLILDTGALNGAIR